jgi:hypothetical protein
MNSCIKLLLFLVLSWFGNTDKIIFAPLIAVLGSFLKNNGIEGERSAEHLLRR